MDTNTLIDQFICVVFIVFHFITLNQCKEENKTIICHLHSLDDYRYISRDWQSQQLHELGARKKPKDTNTLQRVKDTNTLQRAKDTGTLQRAKDTNTLQRVKDTNTLQRVKDTNTLQRVKDTN
jgi:hypothetical protein